MDTSLLTGLSPVCSAFLVAARREVTHCLGKSNRSWRWFRHKDISWPHIPRQTGGVGGGRESIIFVIINSPVCDIFLLPANLDWWPVLFFYTDNHVPNAVTSRHCCVSLGDTIILCCGRQKLNTRRGYLRFPVFPTTSTGFTEARSACAGIQGQINTGWSAYQRQAWGALALAHCGFLKGPASNAPWKQPLGSLA